MSARRSLLAPIVALALIGAASTPLDASQFTGGLEVTWDSIREDSQAFFLRLIFGGVDSNENGRIDPAERAIGDVFRTATLGSCLVGATCGLLGAFVILRRMALFGDMIGHAVLPGVVIGFAIAGTKSTPALLAGALGAGLLAAATTSLISRFTRIKEDAALGISLSVYYALGTWLLIWVTNEPTLSVEASGLDAYLFGNPAVIGNADLASLATAGAIVLAAVVLAWKELLVTTFDPSFASSIGIPRRAVDSVLLVLLTIVIVVSIKILGVVLVAAMLAIPAAASVLLSDRLERVAILSAAIGAISGLLGQYASVILHLSPGPSIVCVAFTLLALSVAFAPRRGLLRRFLDHRRLVRRTARENILSAAWRVRERDPQPTGVPISLADIARERDESVEATRALARRLRGSRWAKVGDSELVLTPDGERRGAEVLRNHRLWELFLAREASLPLDHVHEPAERLEHFLTEDARKELERLLDHPETDPHGKRIPEIDPGPDEVS